MLGSHRTIASQSDRKRLLLRLSALARGLASLSPSKLESCDRSPALQSDQRRQLWREISRSEPERRNALYSA